MEKDGYLLLSPDPTLFDAHSEEETAGGHRKAKADKGDKGRALAGGHGGGGDMSFETLEEFVAGTYVHAHHWFGTCRMGPREKVGGYLEGRRQAREEKCLFARCSGGSDSARGDLL